MPVLFSEFRTLAGSKFGERTGLNPGSADSEFRERLVPFSELQRMKRKKKKNEKREQRKKRKNEKKRKKRREKKKKRKKMIKKNRKKE